jgi:hypothetical protein
MAQASFMDHTIGATVGNGNLVPLVSLIFLVYFDLSRLFGWSKLRGHTG